MSKSFSRLITEKRLIVCAGTGGVGKTTIAAAIAAGAALEGRRAMVLTIDPARQLARALGLNDLGRDPQPVVVGSGVLHAAMLDQKGAWDAFIARHAPRPALRDAILNNRFYRELSSSFAGATEYMAVEELCRLDDSGAFDLIVLDTPPAQHALDFLRAPTRAERFFDRRMISWLAAPYGTGARRGIAAGGTVMKFLLRRLETFASTTTIEDVATFFSAIAELIDGIRERAEHARSLLANDRTAFVLVLAPETRVLAGTKELIKRLQMMGVRSSALVINRVHPLPEPVASESVDSLLLQLEGTRPEVVDWLRRTHTSAVELAKKEAQILADLPIDPNVALAFVPELLGDAHSMRSLLAIGRELLRKFPRDIEASSSCGPLDPLPF